MGGVGEGVYVISEGVKRNSVSERGNVKDFWCWSVIGVVLVKRVRILVGVVFKEGVIRIGLKGGRCKIREDV